MVTVKFFSAGGPASGVELSGTFGDRVISCYGGSGVGEGITVGAAQSVSWITTSGGIPIGSGLSQSGQLNNNQWVDASGVSINSGVRVALSSVKESGNATLRIQVTDTGNINVYNAKVYAYDAVNVNNDPSGVWVLCYEIIPQGRSGLGDTQWALIDATNYNYLVDRTVPVGWAASGEFNYFLGLSCRPKLSTSSGIHTFGILFNFEYL